MCLLKNNDDEKIDVSFLIAVSAISCDINNDDKAEFVLAPVQAVTMPTTFKVDSISKIMISCVRPTDCHIFNGFYYDISGYTRTVAIEFAKVNNGDCQPDGTILYDVPLNFKPATSGTYNFRFWDGQNSDGTDHFAEYEAIVP